MHRCIRTSNTYMTADMTFGYTSLGAACIPMECDDAGTLKVRFIPHAMKIG